MYISVYVYLKFLYGGEIIHSSWPLIWNSNGQAPVINTMFDFKVQGGPKKTVISRGP